MLLRLPNPPWLLSVIFPLFSRCLLISNARQTLSSLHCLKTTTKQSKNLKNPLNLNLRTSLHCFDAESFYFPFVCDFYISAAFQKHSLQSRLLQQFHLSRKGSFHLSAQTARPWLLQRMPGTTVMMCDLWIMPVVTDGCSTQKWLSQLGLEDCVCGKKAGTWNRHVIDKDWCGGFFFNSMMWCKEWIWYPQSVFVQKPEAATRTRSLSC